MSEPWMNLLDERSIRACIVHAELIERFHFDWRDRPWQMEWNAMSEQNPFHFRSAPRVERESMVRPRSLHLDYIYRLPGSHLTMDVHLLFRFEEARSRDQYRCNIESTLRPIRDGRFEFARQLRGSSYEEIVTAASEVIWQTFHELGTLPRHYAYAMSWPGPVSPAMFVNDHGSGLSDFGMPDWRLLDTVDLRDRSTPTRPPLQPQEPPKPKEQSRTPEVRQIEIVRCRRNIIRSAKPKPHNDHE